MAALCALPALALLLLCCPPALPEHMVGAYQTAGPQTEGVQGAAAWATRRYNMQSNCNTVWGLCGVRSARTQVVAGINYNLEVKLCPTVCMKNQPSTQWHSCNLAVGGNLENLDCNFIVYDIPWLNETTLTSWSCKSTRTLGA